MLEIRSRNKWKDVGVLISEGSNGHSDEVRAVWEIEYKFDGYR